MRGNKVFFPSCLLARGTVAVSATNRRSPWLVLATLAETGGGCDATGKKGIKNMNTANLQNILSLSEKDFRELVQDKGERENVRNMLIRIIDIMKYEIERMENHLRGFSARDGNYLIVAGLVPLLSLYYIPNDDIVLKQYLLKQYLIWILPFLIFSFFCFYKSSSRVSVNRIDFPIASEGSESEVLILHLEASGISEMRKKIYEKYERVLFWHRLLKISTSLFILSFIIHYYYIIFLSPLNRIENLFFLAMLLSIGLMMYFSNKIRSGRKVFKM